MSDSLDILYEDNHFIAVVKPAPLLTQGVPAGVPTLEAMVKEYLKQKYHKPGNVYLGIPHRLDRPVSGVIVFGRNTKAARRLGIGKTTLYRKLKEISGKKTAVSSQLSAISGSIGR